MKHIHCALCGKDDARPVLTLSYDMHLHCPTQKFYLVQCKNCELYYLDPQPTWQELAPYYSAEYPSYLAGQPMFSESRVYNALRRLKRAIPGHSEPAKSPPDLVTDSPHKKVLDYGCGNGQYLRSLRQKHPNWELYGFDIEENEAARKSDEGISMLLGPSNLPFSKFPPNSFDLINLSHVAEHLPDPNETLTGLRKLLKEYGELIIEVPNIETIKFKIFGKYFSNLDAPRHLYHYSPKTLSALCEKNGLKIKSVRVFGTTKSTVRSLYNVLGIRKRTLNRFLYIFIDKGTRLIGEKRINTEGLRLICTK